MGTGEFCLGTILFICCGTSVWRCHVRNKAGELDQVQQRSIVLFICDNITAGFSGGAVVKNSPSNAGVARAVGSILGSGRFPGVHSSILAWKTLRTEEPGRLPSMGSQSGHD